MDKIIAVKDEGNAFLKSNQFDEAIRKYTEAISVYESGGAFADSQVDRFYAS
jgi:hypothetical protein